MAHTSRAEHAQVFLQVIMCLVIPVNVPMTRCCELPWLFPVVAVVFAAGVVCSAMGRTGAGGEGWVDSSGGLTALAIDFGVFLSFSSFTFLPPATSLLSFLARFYWRERNREVDSRVMRESEHYLSG